MKKNKTKTKNKIRQSEAVQPTRVVFLLDRTGSMQSVKQETISGFNGYLDTLKSAPRTTVTVVQFDSVGIDSLCEGAAIKDCPRLNSDTYAPRAMTPLYDALGKTITNTRASVKSGKVLFVVLTDGQENASVEWSHDKVKQLMKEVEDLEKWTFAYIGVGPQGWVAMKGISAGLQSSSNVLNIPQDPKSVRAMYRRAGGQSVSYACSVGGEIKKDFWGGDPDKKP